MLPYRFINYIRPGKIRIFISIPGKSHISTPYSRRLTSVFSSKTTVPVPVIRIVVLTGKSIFTRDPVDKRSSKALASGVALGFTGPSAM